MITGFLSLLNVWLVVRVRLDSCDLHVSEFFSPEDDNNTTTTRQQAKLQEVFGLTFDLTGGH